MKRKMVNLIGNGLMVLGMVGMIGSIGLNLFSHVVELGLPDIIVNGTLFGIFIGALVWLVGARMSGREKVEDRYCLLKRLHHPRNDNHRYP
ncbi:DUF2583 family protein [Providencia rustigianii]|uniref:DUF2583 family protein n=1 Tax=Providencia rustigianii TaxID=158850 RepID=UPI00224069E2|nr:DUF2583 family protein [Providencia rustigianii]